MIFTGGESGLQKLIDSSLETAFVNELTRLGKEDITAACVAFHKYFEAAVAASDSRITYYFLSQYD